MLQKLAIDILTSLALEEDATQRIGGTGGVMKELFNIFFKEEVPESQIHVRIAAGEALTMLALESRSNCYHILKLHVLERLIGALEVPLLRESAARILRNLCAFSGEDYFNQLKGVKVAAPTVSAFYNNYDILHFLFPAKYKLSCSIINTIMMINVVTIFNPSPSYCRCFKQSCQKRTNYKK